MESRAVLISIESTSTDPEQQDETIRMITSGTLSPCEGGYLLHYEESISESEPPREVDLRMQNGGVTMSATGAYETGMVFQKGRRFEGQYRTPFGAMDMALYCTSVSYAVGESGGDIALQYQLDINGQYVAMHALALNFLYKEDDD